jgi:hypothetical protein
MSNAATDYDVFISYAREDSAWVRENLYLPLLGCHLPDGRRPRVFFDVGEEGIQIGQSFPDAIANAIQKSTRVVPVYSRIYFSKEMCLFELKKAFQLDPNGTTGKLTPILIAEQGLPEVPFLVNHLNYYTTASTDWFERLCKALGLVRTAKRYVLEFQGHPGDVFVNHTLPVVKVLLRSEDGAPVPVESITIANPENTLHGTTTRATAQGVAVFDDLSIGEPASATCLVARVTGIAEARSRPLAVHGVGTSRPSQPITAAREIRALGEPIFFERGSALAILGEDQASVFDLDGEPLQQGDPLALPQRLRVVRRGGNLIALGDWAGNIHLLSDTGRQHTWPAPMREGGFTVPADLDIVGEFVYAAYWSGNVYRLALDQPPERIALCSEGVQALAVTQDRLLVADFSGLLRIYREGRLVNSTPLDPTVWMLKTYPDGIIAIGDRRCYRVTPDGMQPLGFDLPIDGVASVDENSLCPTVLGADGKGFRMNAHLEFTGFHTTPGAVAVSSDNAGVYCVLVNADGSRTLLVKDRIVFTHPAGTMAVSPRGDWFALGGPHETQLLDSAGLQQILRQGAVRA